MKQMMERLQAAFSRMMVGRYGPDQFSQTLTIAAGILLILSFLFGWSALFTLSLIVLVYAYFRVFSRNIEARSRENRRFLALKGRAMRRFNLAKRQVKEGRQYHFYTCPNPGCRQTIRIPRGKGSKVEITCPKCKTKFIKNA